MKAIRSKIVLVVLAVGLVAAVAVSQTVTKVAAAHAHEDFGFGGHMLGFFTDYLDLTHTQQAQIKAIMAKEKPTIQPLMQQLATGHQQMRQLEESGTFDEVKVRAVASQQAQTMTELMVQKARIKSEMMQVLTADQKAKMAKFTARREQRFQKHLQPTQSQ